MTSGFPITFCTPCTNNGSALGVTDRTVRRDWERARLLLAQLLGR